MPILIAKMKEKQGGERVREVTQASAAEKVDGTVYVVLAPNGSKTIRQG